MSEKRSDFESKDFLKLPEVKIEKSDDFSPDVHRGSFSILNAEGGKIGSVSLELEAEGKCNIDLIELEKDFRGKGYARAVYPILAKQLASEGLKLTSGEFLNPETKRIWEWLVQRGEARKLSEGTNNLPGWDTAQYETI